MRLHQPHPPLRGVLSLAESRAGLAWVSRTVRNCAVQDWWVLAYYVALFLAAWQGSGPMRERCLERTAALVALYLSTLCLIRGGLIRHRVVVPLLYRLVVYGGVQLSYFMLRDLLPTASSAVLDGQLYALDRRLFGVEPTLWADQFVTRATTEWFSFFYFSYFFLLAAHVLPLLFVMRRLRLAAEFALAIFFVFCTAHVLYMLVPGFGPYWYLADRYENPLPHGFFYDLVLDTVSTGGALKDIFPSLHTAAPTAIALFSWRHRREMPFRYTWPITAFFALNIIGATIFLRWHYAIDVVAGLALASASVGLAARIAPREQERRARLGLSTTWPSLPWRDPPIL
jgi:membrane-associated phospholipid phosphatase